MDAKKSSFYAILAIVLSSVVFSTHSYAQDIDTQSLALAESDHDSVLGNKNSPIIIVEYGDYQCPYCAEVYSSVEPRLRREYINSGRAKMIFRNQQFRGDESIAAGAAAACAKDQGKFWAYHDALFSAKNSDFRSGAGENNNFYNRNLFIRLGKQVNLNMASFTSCLDSKKYVDQVKTESDNASSMGVNRTPMMFVNGEEVPNPTSYESVKSVIESKLHKK